MTWSPVGTSSVHCAGSTACRGEPMQLCFICFLLVPFSSYLCKVEVVFLRKLDLLAEIKKDVLGAECSAI